MSLKKQQSLAGVQIETHHSTMAPTFQSPRGPSQSEMRRDFAQPSFSHGGTAVPAMELPNEPIRPAQAPVQKQKSLKKTISNMFKWRSGDIRQMEAAETANRGKNLVDFFRPDRTPTPNVASAGFTMTNPMYEEGLLLQGQKSGPKAAQEKPLRSVSPPGAQYAVAETAPSKTQPRPAPQPLLPGQVASKRFSTDDVNREPL